MFKLNLYRSNWSVISSDNIYRGSFSTTKDSTLPPALTFVDKKSDSMRLQFWRGIQIKILVWVSRQNCNLIDKLTDVIYFMTGFGRDRPSSGRVEHCQYEKVPPQSIYTCCFPELEFFFLSFKFFYCRYYTKIGWIILTLNCFVCFLFLIRLIMPQPSLAPASPVGWPQESGPSWITIARPTMSLAEPSPRVIHLKWYVNAMVVRISWLVV